MTKRMILWLVTTTVVATAGALVAADKPKPSSGEVEWAYGDADHWSFAPVKVVAPPKVDDAAGWIRNPVDAFALAKLNEIELAPAPRADWATLLRRAYLDLIGLAPTVEEQERFLSNPSDAAFERIVDDLLSRPQFGERWGRHWLDVARYAESNGYERDGAKPNAWRYRDYVIEAFNRDKPFDRFVREQIAGDELEDTNAEAQIATTFLRLGVWDDEPAEPLMDRYEQLDDVLGVTATAFLAQTLRCARCHDHKFEPFSQADYYRLLAAFEPLKRPQEGRTDLDREVGTPAELAAYRSAKAALEKETAELNGELGRLEGTLRERFFATIAKSSPAQVESAPAASTATAAPATENADSKLQNTGASGGSATSRKIPSAAIEAFRIDADKQTPEQKALVAKFEKQFKQEIRSAETSEERAQREAIEKKLSEVSKRPIPSLPRAYVWYEEGPNAPESFVLKRGEPASKGKKVELAIPASLTPKQPPTPAPKGTSTGRRLWLANWLTDERNPLTARVWVNRIWQHYFGDGLVATENDFGVMGDMPSHPELLDWLAGELIRHGGHSKPIHRLIVLSSAWRQSSILRADTAEADPNQAHLSGQRRRRLEAEAVRDLVLQCSGELNAAMGGESVYPTLPKAVLQGQSRPGLGWGKSSARDVNRRSVYVFVKRTLAVPELDLLDAPDSSSSCEQRVVSTTAPQALTFLNGDFMNEQAAKLAKRIEREAGSNDAARVERAFRLALCRAPSANELAASTGFLDTHAKQIVAEGSASKPTDENQARHKALAAFCLVLLNTNEFVYAN